MSQPDTPDRLSTLWLGVCLVPTIVLASRGLTALFGLIDPAVATTPDSRLIAWLMLGWLLLLPLLIWQRKRLARWLIAPLPVALALFGIGGLLLVELPGRLAGYTEAPLVLGALLAALVSMWLLALWLAHLATISQAESLSRLVARAGALWLVMLALCAYDWHQAATLMQSLGVKAADPGGSVSYLAVWYLAMGAGLFTLLSLAERLGRWWVRHTPWPLRWLWLLALIPGAGFAYLVTDGAGLVRAGLRWPLFAGMLAVFGGVCVALAFGVGGRLLRRVQSGPLRGLLAAVLLGLAGLLHVANYTLFRGLYPEIHVALLIAVLVLALPPLSGWLRPLIGRGIAAGRLQVWRFGAALLNGLGILAVILLVYGLFPALMPRVGDLERHLIVQSALPLEMLTALKHTTLLAFDNRRVKAKGLDSLIAGQAAGPGYVQSKARLQQLDTSTTRDATGARVILVTIDALRYDTLLTRLLPSGQMPRLAEVVEESTVFRRAYTDYPCTAQALSGLFTGSHPYTLSFVSPHSRSWLEALTDNGIPIFFRAALSQLTYAYSGLWEFIQAHGKENQSDPVDTAEALLFLKQQQAQPDAPFFLYLHLMAPHSPYDTFNGGKDSGLPTVQAYESEIRYTDAFVGMLFDYYRQSGMADNTHFIVMSDHGEALGEFGLSDHCQTAQEFLSHIVLFWRQPGKTPQAGRIDDVVSLSDLGRSLADLYGVSAEGIGWGRSLLPRLRGEALPPRPAVVSAYHDFLCIDHVSAYLWRPDSGMELYTRRTAPDAVKSSLVSEPGPERALKPYLSGFFAAQAEVIRQKLSK